MTGYRRFMVIISDFFGDNDHKGLLAIRLSKKHPEADCAATKGEDKSSTDEPVLRVRRLYGS